MKIWGVSKPKAVKTEITAVIKINVNTFAINLIDGDLKPKHINLELNNANINQLIDIFIKWRGSSLHFYAKYECCG